MADGRRWSRRAWALLVYLWLNSPVAAAEVHLGLDSIDFPGWGARKMQAMLRWRQDGRIDLNVICPHASLTARHPLLGRIHSRLAFRYRFVNGAVRVEATRLTVAGGRGRLSGEWQRPQWVLTRLGRLIIMRAQGPDLIKPA